MNWLAHVLLSPPDIDFQLGNLMADFVRGDERLPMNAAFVEGTCCHARIDAFTDTHPVVRRSKARIDARFRRFAGILVDVFYDHLLARQWKRFCEVPLREFTAGFHREALARVQSLPAAALMLERMIREDRLFSYREAEGVEAALRRLSQRLNERWHRDLRLHEAMPSLMASCTELEEDFLEFFPLLVRHLTEEGWLMPHATRDAG